MRSMGKRDLGTLLSIAVVAVALGGCSSDAAHAAGGPSATASASTTASGLKKARWGKNVTVTYGRGKVRVRSNGIPNHSRPKYYAIPGNGEVVPTAQTARVVADPTRATSHDFSIPLKPKKTSKTTEAPLGSIGFMISGAVLFNPYEGDGRTVAMASNFYLNAPDGSKAPFVDDCSGHPGGGQYHYHGLPNCVVAETDTATGPSRIIGIAFDGFPIYGPRDLKGRTVPTGRLDKCNGITSATPEFPKGIYHYVLPGTTDSTSSIRCFHGKVDSSLIARMPAMGPGQGGPPPGPPPVAATAGAARVAEVAPSFVCDLLGLG